MNIARLWPSTKAVPNHDRKGVASPVTCSSRLEPAALFPHKATR
jgi:hypothetical protein